MKQTETLVTLQAQDLHPRDRYRLLTSLVVPRPIAWVSTLGADGSANLAPFSFFNAVGGNPPTIMISVGQRGGSAKDTLRNIQETGEFVVNLPSQDLAQALNASSANVNYEVDEFELAGLGKSPSLLVRPPRVSEAAAAMEVRATQFVPVEGSHYTLVLGQVLVFHLREDVLRSNGLADAARLDPLARLGGSEYSSLGAVFEMQRPE